MAKTENQTRKASRVTEWQEEAIHAKATTIEKNGISLALASPDKEFIEECWNVLSNHFGCDVECDVTRLQDVVIFKSDMVESK